MFLLAILLYLPYFSLPLDSDCALATDVDVFKASVFAEC